MKNNFIISDHAKEQFENRFPDLLKRFSGNVISAINHELRFSRKNKKLVDDRFKGYRIRQLMKYGYEPTDYYTSKNAVFVVVNNVIKTSYPRSGSIFDESRPIDDMIKNSLW